MPTGFPFFDNAKFGIYPFNVSEDSQEIYNVSKYARRALSLGFTLNVLFAILSMLTFLMFTMPEGFNQRRTFVQCGFLQFQEQNIHEAFILRDASVAIKWDKKFCLDKVLHIRFSYLMRCQSWDKIQSCR